MRAQLDYWIRERRDNRTGLYVWYDQVRIVNQSFMVAVFKHTVNLLFVLVFLCVCCKPPNGICIKLESGQDNLVLSTCPSVRSPDCWNETLHANAIASADVMAFLYREFTAFSKFSVAWAEIMEEESGKNDDVIALR